MWDAATLRRSGPPGPTPSRTGIRSSGRSSRARTGAGVMSTKPSSEVPETPDLQGAYPRLSDAQVAALARQGRHRVTQPGEVLFAEGDRDCDFVVVLAGRVASVE